MGRFKCQAAIVYEEWAEKPDEGAPFMIYYRAWWTPYEGIAELHGYTALT
jgi:hypothetical protein